MSGVRGVCQSESSNFGPLMVWQTLFAKYKGPEGGIDEAGLLQLVTQRDAGGDGALGGVTLAGLVCQGIQDQEPKGPKG
jgi:hypothetical protein